MGRRWWLLCVALMLGAAVIPWAGAQRIDSNVDHVGGMMKPEAGRPSFEVAVIRESKPGAEFRFNGIGMRPQRMEITGTTLRSMVAFAYAVPDEKQLVGGPGWFRTRRFDVTAQPAEREVDALRKLGAPQLHDATRLRLQVLLEERFGVRVHFAQKELPLFALQQARGGLRCKKVAETNTAAFENLPPPPPPPDRHLAGHQETLQWEMPAFPFPMIVSWISQQPEVEGRTVEDRTGLSGGYSCALRWSRDETDPAASSFFTALREQMGLRLQPERGAVTVLMVDQVKEPSAN